MLQISCCLLLCYCFVILGRLFQCQSSLQNTVVANISLQVPVGCLTKFKGPFKLFYSHPPGAQIKQLILSSSPLPTTQYTEESFKSDPLKTITQNAQLADGIVFKMV